MKQWHMAQCNFTDLRANAYKPVFELVFIMIYRITHKLSKKIKQVPGEPVASSANPMLDWAAEHFIAERKHFILLMNCHSMLSCVYPATGVSSGDAFIHKSKLAIRDCLQQNGFDTVLEYIMAPQMDTAQFTKVGNRQITGIMADLVKHAKFYSQRFGATPYEISRTLNEMPQLTQKESSPVKAFANLQANAMN